MVLSIPAAPLVSWWHGQLLNLGVPDSHVGQKVLLTFSIRNFSVTARSLEVSCVTPSCLEKHVKPSDLSRVVSECRPIGL